MSKRSQTAIEFVTLVSFLLFIFTVFFLIIQENMSDKLIERQNLRVKEVAITVQEEINQYEQQLKDSLEGFALFGWLNRLLSNYQ